jgi:hypothetical protein
MAHQIIPFVCAIHGMFRWGLEKTLPQTGSLNQRRRLCNRFG